MLSVSAVDQGLRQREVGPVAQRGENLLLELRVDLALQLEPQVCRDFRAKLFDAAARDAERLGEFGVDFGDLRSFDALQRQLELRVLSGDLRAVIIGRERERKRLGLSGAHSGDRGLELRQHPPFADDDPEVARLATGEFDTVDPAGEVDDHAVAGGRGTLDVVIVGPLAAQHLDRVRHFLGTDFGNGALDRDVGKVADLHFGIDLEYGGKLELVGRRAGPRLDARKARDPQVLLAQRIGEPRLHRIGNDVGAHLRAVLLRNHPHRHLPRTKSGQLRVLGEPGEALIDLGLDLRDRHGHREPALELAERFETGLHAGRILANVNRWCERGDSNPHGLPRWNLNPVRLPIPPLSQLLSPNGAV